MFVFCTQFAIVFWLSSSASSFFLRIAYTVSSVALGWLMIRSSKRIWSRLLISLVNGFVLAAQIAALRFYHALLDKQIVVSGMRAMADVRGVLVKIAPALTVATLVLAAVEYLLLRSLVKAAPTNAPQVNVVGNVVGAENRWTISTHGRQLLAASLLALLPFVLGLRQATPEYRLLEAVTGLRSGRAKQSHVVISVPVLPSARKEVPDVLFLFGESVRASDYCSAPASECLFAPRINQLLPNRVPLSHLRSLASYTAISVGAVFTGRLQNVSLAELGQAPTLFDFARETRVREKKPYSVYYTGQWSTIFERADTLDATDRHLDIENLFGRAIESNDLIYHEGVDRHLVDKFLQDLPQFPSPLMVTLHWAGTHVPYYMDPNDAPFTPYGTEVSWARMPEFHRTYQNAIRTQDREMARAVEAFIASRKGRPWLIVFTSDHGEAFGEHHAIHHGQNLYNEQTHVPGYVAWGNGALSADEEGNLRAHASAPTSHLDVLPTMLDVLGVWDQPLLASYRAKMSGSSWLRPVNTAPRKLPMTNCSASFPCPLNAWGMLGDEHSVIGQPWDREFVCIRLDSPTSDPVDEPECAKLREASKVFFPTLPNGKPNQ
jgi:hypothetical protein